MANLEEIIKVNTEEIQADLVLKNAKLVNVLSEEIYETDIAIKDGKVAGISKGYKGKKKLTSKERTQAHHLLMDTFILKVECYYLLNLQNLLSLQAQQPS